MSLYDAIKKAFTEAVKAKTEEQATKTIGIGMSIDDIARYFNKKHYGAGSFIQHVTITRPASPQRQQELADALAHVVQHAQVLPTVTADEVSSLEMKGFSLQVSDEVREIFKPHFYAIACREYPSGSVVVVLAGRNGVRTHVTLMPLPGGAYEVMDVRTKHEKG